MMIMRDKFLVNDHVFDLQVKIIRLCIRVIMRLREFKSTFALDGYLYTEMVLIENRVDFMRIALIIGSK